jgi:FkbM family methyltransferase
MQIKNFFEITAVEPSRLLRGLLRSPTNFIISIGLFLELMSSFVLGKLLRRKYERSSSIWKAGIIFGVLYSLSLRYPKIQLDGFHLNCPVRSAGNYHPVATMVLGLYEPWVVKRIEKGGNVFVDVGSNMGYFSLMAAKYFNLVVSVEPHPENFFWLRKNIQENRSKNVIPVRTALSNREGFVNLFLAISSGGHSIKARTPTSSNVCSISVPTMTMDDLLVSLGISYIDLIKIDVEGAELEVIRGANGTLEKTNEIIIEVHETPTAFLREFSKRGLEYTLLMRSGGNCWILAKR